MFANDALHLIYNYRNHPDPVAVPHLFKFFTVERVLWNPISAIATAGVVTALCERHPDQYLGWKLDYWPLIKQAIAVSKSRGARDDIKWAEFLVNQWLILGTDKAAWQLLMLCHYAQSENQRMGAQTACDKICRTIDSHPITNARGVVMGTVQFEDMRLQMARLANEFRVLTPSQRRLPFDLLPLSQDSMEAGLILSSRLPKLQNVSELLQ